MKHLLYFLAPAVLVMASCSKQERLPVAEDPGCITRKIVPVTGHSISQAEVAIADGLFADNTIENGNLRYSRTYTSDINGSVYRSIHVQEYFNGLPLFNGWLNYTFKDEVLSSVAGVRREGVDLDISPKLNIAQLRALFLQDIELHDQRAADFTDSCFTAEFGYYNLSESSEAPNIVKAWHVRLGDDSYPEAYYEDDSGRSIYYFNGIVF